MSAIFASLAFLAGMIGQWPAAVLVVAVVIALLFLKQITVVVAFALIGMAFLGALRAPSAPVVTTPPEIAASTSLTGRIATPPLVNGNRTRFDLNTDGYTVCTSAPLLPVQGFGDDIHVTGQMSSLEELTADRRDAYIARGCAGFFTAESLVTTESGAGFLANLDSFRRQFVNQLQRWAPGDRGALMAGLVTGDDGALSRGTETAFVTTGTSHVTAISGSNFALVVSIVSVLGVFLGGRRNTTFLICAVAIVWCYALLVGLGPPPLRAALVATLALLARRLGRLPDFLTIAMIAAVIQLAWRPEDLWKSGFQLSFVASLGLVLVLSGREAATPRNGILYALLAAVAAQLATLPLIVATFGRVSLASIPVNVLIAPLVLISFPLSLLATLAGSIHEPLGEALAIPAASFAGWTISIAKWGASSASLSATMRAPEPVLVAVLMFLSAAGIALLSRDCRVFWQDIRGEMTALTQLQKRLAITAALASIITVAALALR